MTQLTSTITLQLIYGFAAVTGCFMLAKIVDRVHHWKAEHLKEIGAEIGICTVLGIVLTWLFSFRAQRWGFALLSAACFTTFLYPFLAYFQYDDWPRRNICRERNYLLEIFAALFFFAASMFVLGLGIYAACMNSSWSERAVYIGMIAPALAAIWLLFEAATFEMRFKHSN